MAGSPSEILSKFDTIEKNDLLLSLHGSLSFKHVLSFTFETDPKEKRAIT